MSWSFERDEEYIKKRDEVIEQLKKLNPDLMVLMLADFIVMYNGWNWTEIIKALNKCGVDEQPS